MTDMINPIVLTYDDGREYTLEFTRETIEYAERMGFTLDDLSSKMMTRIPELFHYAFRAHHPQLSKKKTDEILFNDLGGMSEKLADRLINLYSLPFDTLASEDENPKNPQMTVHM